MHPNEGIVVTGGSQVTSTDGNISLTGTGIVTALEATTTGLTLIATA